MMISIIKWYCRLIKWTWVEETISPGYKAAIVRDKSGNARGLYLMRFRGEYMKFDFADSLKRVSISLLSDTWPIISRFDPKEGFLSLPPGFYYNERNRAICYSVDGEYFAITPDLLKKINDFLLRQNIDVFGAVKQDRFV